MGGIYWLASYPKSGNTWLRAFLTNYWENGDQPADINALGAPPIATSREVFDDWVGIASSDLTLEEIAYYRPMIYSHMAASSSEPLFIKVHDAFTYNADGQPLFPRPATAGVIYLIRNPLDVAVSYAHHDRRAVNDIIARMGYNSAAMLARTDGIHDHIVQTLLSWSSHVLSWVDESGLPLLVVRYEDMVQKPVSTFTGIVRFINDCPHPDRIQKAVDFSSFDCLRAQEVRHGFVEKQPTARSFFRQGRIGAWRATLTTTQVDQLVADHGRVMRRFGYLTEADAVCGAQCGSRVPEETADGKTCHHPQYHHPAFRSHAVE